MKSPEKTSSKMRLFRHKRPCLMALFFLSALLVIGLPSAMAATWSPQSKAWLNALTYPDEDPRDLGVKTPKSDRVLLEKFRPRVFIAPNGRVPIDFYGFYLPNTVARDEGGAIIKTSPTRAYLKRIEREAGLYLDYQGPDTPCEKARCEGYVAAGYGRAYRETARFRTGSGTQKMPLIILKYNFAFTYSGIPADVGLLKENLLGLFIDPAKFHELDIHGAVHVILSKKQKPLVLLLAQHNYFRSYVFGKDIPAPPADNRVKVCFALRSNEPYPCPKGAAPARRRTVGNPVNMSYVINGTGKPFLSGRDIVFGPQAGARPVLYRLKFLPARDPLYVSWIPLGAKEKMLFFSSFYRKGPPGMDLNSWPKLKKYSDIMQFWYLRDNNAEDATLMREAFRSFTDVDFERVLEHNGRRLYNEITGP